MNAPMIYELRRPSEIDPDKKYPALFIMHGIGSNEQNMLSLVNGLEERFYIFSIRGHLSQPPGFAFFTIEGYGKPHREVFDEGVTKLTNFVDYTCEQYPLDTSQLYLLGFSQGAILAMTLGLTLGDKIKGVVALSGYIPAFVKEEYEIKAVNELSVFISHGEMDQVLPYEWGLANNEYFRQLGANVTFKTYVEGHSVSKSNLQDFTNWLLEDLKNNTLRERQKR
ncbi:esterase [Neobacillus niacini]|uniref:alpha/beta hydrolase n=1 Tax=Neobacillus niacini TaxID=86668 RepID=UPI0007AC0C07|nr:alpha/beta fold hydrolase [Neobacillus niacini]MEC1525018.1 esterase [Neobacillus niacini]